MYLDHSGLMALWDRMKNMLAPKSHTHDISTLDGTAKSAAKLSTARTIALSGAVSGSAKFDGSGDATIVTTGQTATASTAGLMSADDKSKLDSIVDSVSRSVQFAKIPTRTLSTSASHAFTMAVSWPVDVSRIVAVIPTYTCKDFSDRVVLSDWDESGVTLRAGADQQIFISLFVLYV